MCNRRRPRWRSRCPEEAQTLFSDLTGVALGSERLHVCASGRRGLTVLDVAPSRDAIARRIETMATGRVRRPVVVLGIDGAYVPASRRSRSQAGQRHSRARRASWHGQWRDAKGFRFYLIDDEPIVHLLSWHQVQNEAQLAGSPAGQRGGCDSTRSGPALCGL